MLFYLFGLPVSFQPGQEEEQMQRPEVRDEDLSEARSNLGVGGPAKSKTLEVMEECGEFKCVCVWELGSLMILKFPLHIQGREGGGNDGRVPLNHLSLSLSSHDK